MILEKVVSLTKTLEDPKYPLMGPIIKGLDFFGLWQYGPKFRKYNYVHFFSILFVISQFVDLYEVRNDMTTMFNNLSLTVLSMICVVKCLSYLLWNNKWIKLVQTISKMELQQLQQNDKKTVQLINEYTEYTRTVTYSYWVLVFVTNLLLIVSPFFKCFSKSYRVAVWNGEEPLPQIIFSWFPFDNTKCPGYFVGLFVHVFMGCQGSGIIATYDMNAVAIMSYLKGQMMILREKCRGIFDELSSKEITDRIKECHRDHNILIEHYRMLNALLSPTMSLYMIFCSMTICGGVVQFTSKEATTSQKIWVLQYSTGLVAQLFLYCWHSNEVAVQTNVVDRGVYESKWWKGDSRSRKQILLLAAKLDKSLIFRAGPFYKLSVSTFIDIMKGSYSFYTLFTQMQDNK